MNHPARNISKGADQNKRNQWGWVWRFLLPNIVLLLCACQASYAPGLQPIGSQLSAIIPSPMLLASSPSTTPTSGTTQSQPEPRATQTIVSPANSSITTFPTNPGTTWVYLKKGYTQADGEPQKIIHGTSKIVETIVDEKEVAPYFLVHIKGNKTMVSADDGWQENGTFGLGDYEYWYLFKDNLIYSSFTKPDLAQIKMDALRLDFQFPLIKGSEWCITTLRRGSVEHPTPDPNSPCESSRLVVNMGSYSSAMGILKLCYEVHDRANSGDVITEYCDGIGIAAVKYDHGGSLFGSSQELISFSPGKTNSSP